MATRDELYEAVKETLEQEGVLRKIKAQVQSEVTKMLFESVPSSPQRPGLPQDLVLINELVKQYLEWIGYSYTLPIFNIESGCTGQLSQEELAQKFNMKLSEKTKKVPLLYSLVMTAKKPSTV
nr:PREDICTED: lisH domain-containing protein FOPNL [Bemisia tabaci]